jgi:hypothetical protein
LYLLVLVLVNGLLTFFIKVNISAAAESQFRQRGYQDEEDHTGSLELLDLASWWRHGQYRRRRLSQDPNSVKLRKRLLLQALFACPEFS